MPQGPGQQNLCPFEDVVQASPWHSVNETPGAKYARCKVDLHVAQSTVSSSPMTQNYFIY